MLSISKLYQEPSYEEHYEQLFGIQSVINNLSSQERKVVNLRSKGYKYKEIAKKMGISIGSVGVYLKRARMSIKKEISCYNK